MKTRIALIVMALTAWHVTAQTYFNQWFTNWHQAPGGGYSCTNSFEIGSNTVAVLVSYSLEIAPAISVESPQGTVEYDTYNQKFSILGPCTAQAVYSGLGITRPQVTLWKLETVNAVTSPGAVTIQPAGFAATIGLQTSTNLSTWQTLTNASFGATNANRFFRLSLSIQ